MAMSDLVDTNFVNKLMYAMDQTTGGIDKYGFWIYADITPEDKKQALTDYYIYKASRLTRPTAQELAPTAHGTNKSTESTGNGSQFK